MTDVRNILLIHAYDRVAAEILVGIVRYDIPPLLGSVKRILGEAKDSCRSVPVTDREYTQVIRDSRRKWRDAHPDYQRNCWQTHLNVEKQSANREMLVAALAELGFGGFGITRRYVRLTYSV